AGQVDVQRLLAGVPQLAPLADGLVAEQLAQVDSKDMDGALWLRLLQACQRHLASRDMRGIVITHGTDTMEETAFFLDAVLNADGRLARRVGLPGARHPASSAAPDGPSNLFDAVTAAGAGPELAGVHVAFAGTLHAAEHVRKLHNYRLDAFGSGEA